SPQGVVYPIETLGGVAVIHLPLVSSAGVVYSLQVKAVPISIGLAFVPSSGGVYLLTVVQGAAILRLPSISPQGMVFGIQVVDALVRRFVFRLPSLEAVDRVVLEPREAVDLVSFLSSTAVDTVILKEGAMADYPRAG